MTAESHARFVAAMQLVETCALDLGAEVALTGSVARGTADRHSDVELDFWVSDLPGKDAVQSWLAAVGATEVSPGSWDEDPTGFIWIVCRFAGFWFELGWALDEQFDGLVGRLAQGGYTDHLRLQMGQTVQEAIPLRSHGLLERWKNKLDTYPAGLRERIAAEQTAVWGDPHVPDVRWGLAAREQRLGLALRFTWDMENLLRLLFALNEVWDRDLKWTDESTLGLAMRPAQLVRRIDESFRFEDLRRSVEVEQRLIVEALELAVDAGLPVAAALASMRAGLQRGLGQSC